MIKLSGLWMKKDKNGNTYFSGSLNGANILIFKNKSKEKPNQPDYNFFVAEKKKDEKSESSESSEFGKEEIPF